MGICCCECCIWLIFWAVNDVSVGAAAVDALCDVACNDIV